MKKAVLLLILLTGSFAFANAQESENYLQEGNVCFEQGDYDCAQNKYRLAKAMQTVSNIDELIKKAEECKKNFSEAEAFFKKEYYKDARDSYQKVLDLNVNDPNAKKQYDLCVEALKPKTEPEIQPVTKVALNKTIASLEINATETLTATVAPVNATNKTVTWSSSNKRVATVNTGGLVTALAKGAAIITATTVDGNKTATCMLTVTKPKPEPKPVPKPESKPEPKKPEPKPEPSGDEKFILMAGVSIGSSLSYSLMAGFVPDRIGGYVKAKSDFSSKGDAYTYSKNDVFFNRDFKAAGRWGASVGLAGKFSSSVLGYAGLGYGGKWTEWKDVSGRLCVIDEYSFEGIEPEIGLIFKINKFVIGGGASFLMGKQTLPEFALSVGLAF